MECAYVCRVLDMIEAEEKARLQEWLIGEWVAARGRHHAFIADKDVPQTKADQKKKPSEFKIAEAKAFRQKHDPEWYEALSSPRHFGAFLGMEGIMGPPPEKPPEKSREEKIRDGFAAAHRALKGILGQNT